MKQFINTPDVKHIKLELWEGDLPPYFNVAVERNDGIIVKCRLAHGFTEPQVYWLDTPYFQDLEDLEADIIRVISFTLKKLSSF